MLCITQKDFYTLKELEKLGPKLKGIGQSNASKLRVKPPS